MTNVSSYQGRYRYSDVRVFATAGTFTWVRPYWAREIMVRVVGGGGGGGAGQSGSGNRFGGGGGGGGSPKFGHFHYLDFAYRVTVVVGDGGNGGVVGGAAAQNGNYSYVAVSSNQYPYIIAYGGGYGSAGAIYAYGGGCSSIGRPANGSTGGLPYRNSPFETMFDGMGSLGIQTSDGTIIQGSWDTGPGGESWYTIGRPGASAWLGGAGGGSGAGCTDSDSYVGGAGGTYCSNTRGGGGAGGIVGGGIGSTGLPGNSMYGGQGGGGGGSNRTGVGGVGGVGGIGGGGGGGGGAGATGGNGGKGGCGYVMIISIW